MGSVNETLSLLYLFFSAGQGLTSDGLMWMWQPITEQQLQQQFQLGYLLVVALGVRLKENHLLCRRSPEADSGHSTQVLH